MQSNPEMMQNMMAETVADFQAADANGDGCLDLAEWTVFRNQQSAKYGERGHFMDEREEQIGLSFGIMDDFNTETTGVSLQDYLSMFGIWMHKF